MPLAKYLAQDGNGTRMILAPGADGALREVWAGVRDATDPWLLAALPKAERRATLEQTN